MRDLDSALLQLSRLEVRMGCLGCSWIFGASGGAWGCAWVAPNTNALFGVRESCSVRQDGVSAVLRSFGWRRLGWKICTGIAGRYTVQLWLTNRVDGTELSPPHHIGSGRS